MITVTAEEIIRCTPTEFLDFVLDPERYAEVDSKIGKIDWVRRDGDVVDFRFRSALPGIPGPAPKVVSRMRLTPGERVDIAYAPLPHNKLNHRISSLQASFVCDPVLEGTLVRRTLSIEFIPVLRQVIEPILRRSFPDDLSRELRSAREYLERH